MPVTEAWDSLHIGVSFDQMPNEINKLEPFGDHPLLYVEGVAQILMSGWNEDIWRVEFFSRAGL